MSRYFVKPDGSYIGAFEGAEAMALVQADAVEVSNAPAHALDTWDGLKWVPHVPAPAPVSDAEAIRRALIKKGLVTALEIDAEKAR